jgi:ATP phosphoribosyltransferase regulatory subunit
MRLLSKKNNNFIYGDCEKRESAINDIKQIFKRYGYKNVMIPTFQEYDTFVSINGTVKREEMFKFIDKSGDVVVLRPDCTTSIAKMAASNYQDTKGYLKLFYASNIFRMRNSDKGEQNEFMQIGAEYLGNESVDADGEIIALAIKAIKTVVPDLKIDIGQSEYFKGLMEEISLDEEKVNRIRRLVENKNLSELEWMLQELNLEERIKQSILNILNLYGDVETVLKKGKEYSLNKKMDVALNNIKEVYDVLSDYGCGKYISLDLGLITDLEYYSGVIFKGYIPYSGKIVLNGGRYDRLTESFGASIPATGFGINIDEIMRAAEGFKDKEQETDYLILYKDGFRKASFELAEYIRAKGAIVETDIFKDFETYTDTAKERNIGELIIYSGDKIRIIDVNKNKTINIKADEYFKIIENRYRKYNTECKIYGIH